MTGLFATFNPETLRGEPLERFPYLRNRLEHLRVIEIRDTSQPRPDLAPEAAQLAALRIGAALIIGFATQGRTTGFIALCSTLPRDSWDANLHLMLKLLGSSYATGIERVRYQRHLKQIEERDALALYGANDGLVGLRPRSQDHVFLAALEGDARLRRRRGRAADRLAAAGASRTISSACARRCAITSPATSRCSRACIACATATASGAGS